MSKASELSPVSPVVSWMRLFRLPNVFTALADVAMGFLVVQQSLTPVPSLVALLVASTCLYTAGMVLNDVFDVEQDRQERPQRPLPSGQISLGTARTVGFGLLLVGVAVAAVAGYLPGVDPVVRWRSGAVAVLLALCVILYDQVLKRTPIGPIFMGLCRFFNVLLGMSIAAAAMSETTPGTLYFTAGQLLIAAALGVYVLGITMFARSEAATSQQIRLVQGMAVMGFGISILLLVPGKIPAAFNPTFWPLLLAVLGISVARHCINAILDPTPTKVQWAVKFAILSIITFDAAVALLAAGPAYALGIFALVIPTMLLGKIIYST